MSDLTDRRVKLLRITPSILVEVLKGRLRPEKGSALPRDAEGVASYYDLHTDQFILKICHSDFEPVADGCQIPEIDTIQLDVLP